MHMSLFEQDALHRAVANVVSKVMCMITAATTSSTATMQSTVLCSEEYTQYMAGQNFQLQMPVKSFAVMFGMHNIM